MTKQIIRTQLNVESWISGLDGKTIREAIGYLSQYADNVVLDEAQDYDYSLGHLYTVREETDEEYAARLAQEAEDEHQRAEAKRKAEEQLAMRMMLIAAKDVAFKAYMEKHKDNPNIGDLSNLFLSVMSLTKAGVGGNAVGPLLECMERLEKEGGTA